MFFDFFWMPGYLAFFPLMLLFIDLISGSMS